MVAALAKAKSLAEHLAGTDSSEAAVSLTDREAKELVDHLRLTANHTGVVPVDVTDPWQFLATCRLMGFDIVRIPGELH